MIASLLKMMGFGAAKPAGVRAHGEAPEACDKPTARKSAKPQASVKTSPPAAKAVTVKPKSDARAKRSESKTTAAAPVAPAPTVSTPPKVTIASKPASPVAPPEVPLAAATGPRYTSIPAKSVRPSSRLAQLTVPSMAPTVASTAAKSSYSQNLPPPMIAPPPHVAAKKDPKLANNWKTTPADQLSDAEVLAMPDSEYMNEKQTAFFRLKLTVLKQDMLNNAGETTEHLREDTVVVPDPADRATIEEEHALELRTRDRERKLLKKIEQSIQRIDAGDYGYCDETGEPIGVGRLLARPTATLSLEAQQRRELKQKMFGD